MAERARYERAVVEAILREGYVCHVGFSVAGDTWVVPTAYALHEGALYLHGARGNHAWRHLASGVPACVTVTIVDGLVLARAALHHSMNYRSVMLFGRALPVEDEAEKRRALDAVVDHVVPGRSRHARQPTASELRATTLLRFPIDEASAKVRTGGPKDDEEDLESDVWAGVIPIAMSAGAPVPEPGVTVAIPSYARNYARPAG